MDSSLIYVYKALLLKQVIFCFSEQALFFCNEMYKEEKVTA